MINVRILAIAIFGAVLSTPSIYSQDLSRYREFQFGTGLPASEINRSIPEENARVKP
jgi:hypothetical protein